MPKGEMNVDLSHISYVSSNRQPHAMRRMRNLNVFGYSAKTCDVRLDKMHRPSV
jgi:hypothetical protein